MTTLHHRTCGLCDALCRIRVEVEDGQVRRISGLAEDPFSMGHICPKAVSLGDLQTDPDRLRSPMRRTPRGWEEVSWDDALDEAATRLARVRRDHGHDAVGLYLGNPNVHHYGNVLALTLLTGLLDSRARFSAQSLDNLPHAFAAHQMFGHNLLMPVPDIDRTDWMLILGANPWVANGGGMSSGHVRRRFEALRARGGRVVVCDPRRTETARHADVHHAIRPGGDAALLLGMLHTVFDEGLVVDGPWRRWTTPLEPLAAMATRFPVDRVAPHAGLAPEVIRQLARQLARTPRAVIYPRLGACTQAFGGLTCWLVTVLCTLTNHLDTPGGLMFSQPPIDIVAITKLAGVTGSYLPGSSRRTGLPSIHDELPVASLCEEIETPGAGQVRAMITLAANPVLTAPNGPRLEAALSGLDVHIAIDPYLNETSRLADLVLPAAMPLERAHYPLGLSAITVRTVAAYSEPLFPLDGARDDWDILTDLTGRLARTEGRWGWRGAVAAARRLGAEGLLDLLLKTGPHGTWRGGTLDLDTLRKSDTTVDLGPMTPSLPHRIATESGQVHLTPRACLADLDRLDAALTQDVPPLVLIGRRHLRSANSWLHNSHRLVKGKDRCTLRVHPRDAVPRQLASGDEATLSTHIGTLRVRVEVNDEMRPGVVSLPHGWGHHRSGTRQRIAREHAGVSINDILDHTVVDPLTGTSVLNGQAVHLEKAPPEP
jgi:anaerobic selenocysteine-containing dehydrogenase